MRELAFYFLYGMLTLTGAFLSVFWLHFAYVRAGQIPSTAVRYDRYFWLCLALGVHAFGALLLFGTRTYLNMTRGLSNQLIASEGLLIGIGLAIILVAKAMMVWLADLESPRRPLWLWGMGGITFAWGMFVLWFTETI